MMTARCTLFALCLSACSLHALEPAVLLPLPNEKEAAGSTFLVECQMVTVPAKLVPVVVPALSDEAKVKEAWEKLWARAGDGEVTTTGQLIGRGAERQIIRAQSVEEMRFVAAYHQPQLPTPVPPAALETIKNWPHVGVTPSEFETREVGQTITLELGRTANPAVLICSYVVEHSRFEKFVKIDAGRLVNGERLAIEQPYFTTMRDQSQAALTENKPKLIGVHRLPGPDGLYELFVLTVRQSSAQVP